MSDLATYVTSWATVADGEGGQMTTPALFVAHPLPLNCWWQDVTATADVPPDPNLVVVLVGQYEQASAAEVAGWLAAVAGDPDVLEVWRE